MRHPDPLTLSKVLGKIFMRLMGLTWRVKYIRPPAGRRKGKCRGEPALFAFWHGRQLPLIHTHRNEGVTVLVSRNTDGQYATNVLHSMGFSTIRGSSSRGGMEALRKMASRLRAGDDCAITPDGPRGPAEQASGGAGVISRLGGRQVVAMGSSAWPAIRFNSWDRFLLPLPFSKVTVVESAPIIPMPRGDNGEWIRMLESRMDIATATADMAASPAAWAVRTLIGCIETAAVAVASPLLLTRPARERRERLGRVSSQADRPVWLHGSSLGELKGLIPFLGTLDLMGISHWVTCTTPAGRKFLEENAISGSFAPLDTPACVERFIVRVRPGALVLAETELWPSMLTSAVMAGIPMMMVNGRISEGSMSGYRLMKPLLRRLFSCFTGILTRTGEDAARFLALGAEPERVTVTADAKCIHDSGDPPVQWRRVLSGSGLPVLVAGSVRKGEETVVASAARTAGFLPVLAPRHLDRVGDCLSALRDLGYTPALWSSIFPTTPPDSPDSVVVDVHGVLSRLYGSGDAAFVGGTIHRTGGHNIMEPLQRGIPVVVGPHHWHFGPIVEKGVEHGVISVASDSATMAEALGRILHGSPSPEDIRSLSEPAGPDPVALFRELLTISGVTRGVV